MMFVPPSSADQVWTILARSTISGELGCSAKIAPCLGQNTNVLICVYVRDCTIITDVKRVLLTLQDAIKTLPDSIRPPTLAGFKPDIFTDLGIYQQNHWRLPPVLYTVEQISNWDVSEG